MRRSTLRRALGTFATALMGMLVFAGLAAAATVVVTQNSDGWHVQDTRDGGTVTFTTEYGAPPGLGTGSLKLTTPLLPLSAKADYYTDAHAGTPLAAVTDLAYWTYQAPTVQPPVADASYQLQVDLNGAGAGGFTTFVFEPYWNPTQGPIVPATWQHWDVDSGLLWSSKTFAEGTCAVVSGAGGPPLYTLTEIKTLCPGAVVLGIGVNVGSFNPGYTVAVDGVQFNDTTYDFEVGRRPTNKDECKNGGWMSFNDPSFKNQGECVSYANAQDRG